MLPLIQQLYMDTCMQWNCGGNNVPFKLQVETVGFLVPDLCFWRSCYMFWSKRAACVTPLVISTNLSLRDLCHYYVSKEILLRTESPQEGSPPSVGLVRPRRAISMSGVDNTSSQGGNGFSLSFSISDQKTIHKTVSARTQNIREEVEFLILRSPKVANIIESSSVCLASSWRLCMMVGHVRWVRGSPAINIPWKTLKLHHARPARRWWWRGWGCSWS